MKTRFMPLFAALALSAAAVLARDDVSATQPGNRQYSPYPQQTFPNRVFFGDAHLHTSYSTDAGMIGNTLGPEEAYRFARGETVTSSTGLPVKLTRPLDFLVVADHAESLGAAPAIAKSAPVIMETEFGRKLYEFVKAGKPDKAYDLWLAAGRAQNNPLAGEKRLIVPAWKYTTTAADTYNEPGRFTAFIGFEFTPHPHGNNLHRVVVFRDAKDKADEVMAGWPAPQSAHQYARQTSAAGLAAVWARENTREALWDAMARKETYATTGTRIRVRVFAGWDFKADDLYRSDFVAHGYAHGVPMGGDLKNVPAGKAPAFMVQALRDPDGANLDRIQIIKGWPDANGQTHERIWDAAVSDGRTIGPDGRCKQPVGITVNVAEATYTNAIGDAVLGGYWQDPDFDRSQRAFHYVRVIEIPTPRWTTYDAKFFGVKRPEDVPASIQERAYTSPIWYTPGS